MVAGLRSSPPLGALFQEEQQHAGEDGAWQDKGHCTGRDHTLVSRQVEHGWQGWGQGEVRLAAVPNAPGYTQPSYHLKWKGTMHGHGVHGGRGACSI